MGSQSFEKEVATRSSIFNFDPDDLVIIGLDTDDGPEHPLYDESVKEPLPESFVLNVAELGVLETVGIRKNGDVAEVVYGRKRVRAGREANKRRRAKGLEPIRIPCQVKRGEDADMLGMVVSENEIRKQKSPMQRARFMQRMLDMGHTEESIAVHFGMTAQTVRNTVQLLDLDRSVQKMVDGGRLSATAATKLSGLKREEQKTEAAKLLESGQKPTVAAAARAANTKKNGANGASLVAPSKRELRRVLTASDANEVELHPEFVRGLRFALGDLSATSIKGMTAAMAAK